MDQTADQSTLGASGTLAPGAPATSEVATSEIAASVAPAAQREPAPSTFDDSCALSYAGLRRFFFLVVAVLGGAVLLQAIAPTLLLFTVVFLLAMVLNPLVSGLEKRGVKRGLAVLLIILSLLGTVVLLGFLIVPPMLQEINHLAEKAPDYWKNIRLQSEALNARYPALDRLTPELEKLQQGGGLEPAKIGSWAARILSYTFGLVGAIFGGVIALLLLVFTLSTPQPLVAGFLAAIPERHREASGRSLARVQEQMSAWAKATLINGLITGVSTGLLLHFIGVQPALVFGMLAFFGEFVPNIGPLIASVPALFVALGMGTDKFALALVAIIFVQQVESNLLVPFIMGRSMQLHPVTIVFFALAMGSLLGVVGAILAVPAAAIAKVLWDEFYLQPQRLRSSSLEQVEERADDLVAGRGWSGEAVGA